MSKVVKNYFYNLTFQFINLLIPLLTVPYLARVLGAEGIGSFSYYYSIATLFSQFIILGMGNYGNRCIAKCLGDKDQLSLTFSELFYMEVGIGSIVMFAYLFFALFLSRDLLLSLCLIPVLFSSWFDVNWYLYGREKFKVISLRGIVVKIVTTALIFLFVKERSDVVIYTLIMAGSIFLTQAIAWPLVLKEVCFVKVKTINILKHIKPNLVLFIPIVAVSVYRTISKILLGSLTTVTEVGYFENAEKLVSAVLSIIVALGTVMLPRITALFEEKNDAAISTLMSKTFVYTTFMSAIFCFGVFSVSDDLVLWFLGEEFRNSIPILQLLCLTIPFISFTNIIRTQILIPRSLDKPFVISCIAGAVVNLLANLIFIRLWGGKGAAFSTLLAELTVFVVQYYYCKEVMSNYLGKDHLRTLICLYVDAILMVAALILLDPFVELSHFKTLLVKTVIGAMIYSFLVLLHIKVFGDKILEDFMFSLIRKNNR